MPKTPSRREHTITFKIPFSDVDMVGIVYTPRFADYILRGWEEYFRDLGIPWESFAGGDIIKGLPVVRLSLRFTSPAHCADTLAMTTRVTKLTKRRLYFRFELVNCQENRTVAIGSLVAAAVDGNYRPTAIPEFIVKAITGRGSGVG